MHSYYLVIVNFDEMFLRRLVDGFFEITEETQNFLVEIFVRRNEIFGRGLQKGNNAMSIEI